MTDTAETMPLSDHDSPWKEALEGYFPEFLALLFPRIHAGIDWSRGHRFLDKGLIRLMYDRGYARKTILELFRVIDWMVQLPGTLETTFRQEIFAYEESKQMPYVTTVERAGIKKGYRQGEADLLLWLIERKFGETSARALRERVESADSDTLRLWSERILTADTPDEGEKGPGSIHS